MPRYEFKCRSCDRTQELIASIRDDVAHMKLSCDWCGGEAVFVPSAPNFHVKGFNAANGYSKGVK